VNVYVKMFTNSPFLVCMDLALSQEEVVDPKYLWTGPDGKNLEGYYDKDKCVLLWLMSKLYLFVYFWIRARISDTKYTDTDDKALYKIQSVITAQNSHTNYFLKAYREADHMYQVFVRSTTEKCELAANIEELKQILNNIISDLTCHIVESSYNCQFVKTAKQGLLCELFVHFQVTDFINPFAPGWEEVSHQVPYDCEDVTNTRVQEARDRIGEFFSQQMYALKHEFQTVATTHSVDNSFSVTHVDGCRPGFGKNNITHKNCTGCCVVCDPRTYSPNNGVTCQICTRPRVKKYGARSC
ncbi:ZPBP2 protein, partial [Corythaeola cristata]|nr:ZPBP2 protein [Corythaeola cristata]